MLGFQNCKATVETVVWLTDATMCWPMQSSLDGEGGLLIADCCNSVIRRVLANGIVATVAGVGQPGSTGDSGPATMARLNFPQSVASAGMSVGFWIVSSLQCLVWKSCLTLALLFSPQADTTNFAVRFVDQRGIIRTIAGVLGSSPSYNGDGWHATAARLSSVVGIALDLPGTGVYIVSQHARVGYLFVVFPHRSFPLSATRGTM